MIPLQHQALITHAKSNKFDANNVHIMNVLFDMEGERMQMTEMIEDYHGKISKLKKSLSNDEITIDRDLYIRTTELQQRIETILFDTLRYDSSDEARANPEWKEYFHSLYSYFIVPISRHMFFEDVRNAKTSCQMFRAVRRPGNNPPGPLTHMLDRLFIAMKIEYKKLPDIEDMVNNSMMINIDRAREMIKLGKERDELVDKFEEYDDVIAWSLM